MLHTALAQFDFILDETHRSEAKVFPSPQAKQPAIDVSSKCRSLSNIWLKCQTSGARAGA